MIVSRIKKSSIARLRFRQYCFPPLFKKAFYIIYALLTSRFSLGVLIFMFSSFFFGDCHHCGLGLSHSPSWPHPPERAQSGPPFRRTRGRSPARCAWWQRGLAGVVPSNNSNTNSRAHSKLIRGVFFCFSTYWTCCLLPPLSLTHSCGFMDVASDLRGRALIWVLPKVIVVYFR